MENRILIDFMMYSYFGIVPRELYESDSYEDDCVRKAIMKAYVDATNEGAYNTLFTKQAKEKNPKIKEYSENAKKSGAQKIFKEICSLSCNDETSFTQWHKKLCDMLVSEYSQVYVEKDKPFFTYGNAQKWVNMSLKYIFITQNYCGKCGQNVNSVKNFLHIPLDSYIISALKNEGVEIKEKWSQIAEYGKSDDRNKASYMAYVNDIKEIAKAPIEWENTAWIEQAEKAKKKDKDKQYQSFWG